MAKIDTTKIEGYDKMTPEEKLKALEAFEYEDNSESLKAEVEKYKNASSKANSEAAEYKRQLKEKMSAEEVKAKEETEKMEKLQEEHDALLKKVSLSENKAKFLALGYDDALAGETAEALVNGDMDKVFANQKKYQESLEKKVRSDVLKDTPNPAPGSGAKSDITKEQFKGMSYGEKAKLYTENKELYDELSKDGGNE